MSDTEESRVASLGRKRRQNPDVLQSARDAEKRRKLDSNADFVALDSDDNSETVSEDGENGEVSSINNSTHSLTPGEKPDTPPNTTTLSPKDRYHPSRNPRLNSSKTRVRIDLDAVYPDSLQKFVRQQLKEREDFDSIEAVLAEYAQKDKPHCRKASDFLRDFDTGYAKHLGDYKYSDLKSLVATPRAFGEPLDIDHAIKGLAQKPSAAERDFGALLHEKCSESPWKTSADVVFDQLKNHKNHKRACRVLQNYLRESLLPEHKPATVPEVAELDDAPLRVRPATAPEDVELDDAPKDHDARNNVHLSELSKDELREQALYANLTKPSDPVKCLSCGTRGHKQTSCPHKTCSHCGSKSHYSPACPSHQKCTRCRQRGHRSTHCTHPSKMAGGIGDECDECGECGHAEEECAAIWQTFRPTRDNVQVIPEKDMAVSCYNCGRTTHWGDDCPALPDFVGDFITFDTWSGKNASRYIAGQSDVVGGTEGSVAKTEAMESPAGGMPAHQVAMLGEWA
jgi:hypothetical protein